MTAIEMLRKINTLYTMSSSGPAFAAAFAKLMPEIAQITDGPIKRDQCLRSGGCGSSGPCIWPECIGDERPFTAGEVRDF